MYPPSHEMDEYAGELPEEEFRRLAGRRSAMRRSFVRRPAVRRPPMRRSVMRRAAFRRPGLRRAPLGRRSVARGLPRTARFRAARRRPYPNRWPGRYPRRRRWPWPPRLGAISYPGLPAGSEFMRWVQATLNQVLSLSLPVNGIAGPETRRAIRGFQERNGLPANGFVGPDTRQALARALQEGTAPAGAPASAPEPGAGGATANGSPPAGPASDMAPPPEGAPAPDSSAPQSGELMEFEVHRRSRAYVRWLQAALNHVLRTRLPVNGYFGRATRAALMAFQRHRRLRADGRPGPLTEGALIAAGAPRPPGYSPRPAPTTAPSPGLPAGLSGLRRRIVQVALQELARWGNGRIKEGDPSMRSILTAYWRNGAGYMPSGATWWSSVPWSAAFISYVMRQAGAGSSFRYSGGHSYYTVAAKNNRLANNSNPFKAYRITEVSPRLGDLVCKSRSGSGATYDNIREGMATHCDIVVEIQPGRLITVGGNVSDSVKTTPVSIDSRGRITQSGYFAVIQTGP
jgi:peptidoglycan hydrolase-like protein with peptidoglycan-binding domain